jgi:hypothetical protein
MTIKKVTIKKPTHGTCKYLVDLSTKSAPRK